LLDQQMWYFGCDIRRKEGNALLEYGFERQRPPEGVKGSSQYCLQMKDETQLLLWGFGFYFRAGSHDGLLLRRYDFSPRLLPAPNLAWKPEDLQPLRLPESEAACERLRELLPAALRWLADYEDWILAHLGEAYRADCLAAWPKRVATTLTTTSQAWRDLAQACDAIKVKQP